MPKLLVIHGAGMSMRGKAQIDVFGPMTLPQYDERLRAYAAELGCDIDIFHSNAEGEVVDRLYRAHGTGLGGCIINPAGFTVGYGALNAAITQVDYPTIEVHISNPALRGRISDVGRHTRGVVTGFGIQGYYLAMKGLLDLARQK
ncbi:MAG: type II 3-dehydroquinate dehydratase [Burkholderiales bacterium]|nr:type II 3-dehydroquinate dehydratase [Burkholderiales bacterium]